MPANALTEPNYAFLERFIHQETGIALGRNKLYLLESRLMPVLQDEHFGSLNDLCKRLRSGAPELLRRRVAESMTTHETSFFRDPAVFDVLRVDILPALARERQSAKTLRIWSAACSSGQEPYSLAMLLLEAGYSDWRLDILGTDLSSRILARAAAGRFLQIEINRGIPAPLLVKYFQRAGLDWQIKDEVRRIVRLAPFDLRQSAGNLGVFDIVLCRNVLIYFDMRPGNRSWRSCAPPWRPAAICCWAPAKPPTTWTPVSHASPSATWWLTKEPNNAFAVPS
jgi:chemotaxis protein methyltransferase CheR